MTNEEISEAAKAYAPNSLALRIPTTIREHQKRDIEAAFIAGAKWAIKKLSEHTQNQKRNKTMDETGIEKFWGCSNPQVKDGTLLCDGNCSICGYRYTIDTNEVINDMYKYKLNIDLAEGKDVSVENTFIGGKLIDSKKL